MEYRRTRMKLKDLPIDLQKKYIGEVDVDGMQRIQFYPQDLEYFLQIGTIADMHVDVENGTQVLRMTVIPPQPTEYKTVRAPKGAVPLPRPKKQPKTAKPEVKKKSFLEALVGKPSGKPNNTDWIKKFSEGPKF